MDIKDLNLIRVFWACAHSGSLSKAAKQLASTQPTLTRQLQQLEQSCQLNLFARSNKGLQLTEQGKALLEQADQFMQQADAFLCQLAGQEQQIAGVLRISANDIIAHYCLPAAISQLQQQQPDLQIELDINNQMRSLSAREADMAFRMQAPTQPQLVAVKLAELPLGLYAHSSLAKKITQSITDSHSLKQAPLIGFDQQTGLLEYLQTQGITLSPSDFALRCDNLLSHIQLARAGAGIAVMQTQIAKQYPELIHLPCKLSFPSLPLWLVCHQDVQYSQRILMSMQFFKGFFQDNPYQQCMI